MKKQDWRSEAVKSPMAAAVVASMEKTDWVSVAAAVGGSVRKLASGPAVIVKGEGNTVLVLSDLGWEVVRLSYSGGSPYEVASSWFRASGGGDK